MPPILPPVPRRPWFSSSKSEATPSSIIPFPDEFSDEIEKYVLAPRRERLVIFAKQLIDEYRRSIAKVGVHPVIVKRPSELKDHDVAVFQKEMRAYGWSLSFEAHSSLFFSLEPFAEDLR